MKTELDHLVVTAYDLAAGVAFVERTLGVRMQQGGEHKRMGTHNSLLRLGPRIYLEVIAVNPQAPRPARPRWFGLDTLTQNDPPRLAAWVARTDAIHAAVAASEVKRGQVEPMSRGDYNWMITIPADGSHPLNGAAPLLIQWDGAAHPADQLADSGCTLEYFEIASNHADELSNDLLAIDISEPRLIVNWKASVVTRLNATIRTSSGIRTLT